MEESPPFKYVGQKANNSLAASVSNVLDIAGIHSVLWGQWLTFAHGIANLIEDWEIVVPDEDFDRAYHVLLERGFLACPVGKGCPYHLETERTEVERMRAVRPPSKHLHLHDNDPRTLLLHEKSEILWTVSTFEAFSGKDHPEAKVILASDRDVLPAPELTGQGAFSDTLPPVRILSMHCLVETLIRLAARDYDTSDDALFVRLNRWIDDLERFILPNEDSLKSLQEPYDQYMDSRCRDFLNEIHKRQDLEAPIRALKRSFGESN